MKSAPATDDLFASAAGMAGATNYADWTFSLFAPWARGRVLEVGCGVGTFTKLLVAAPQVERLVSIDVSAAAVEKCRTAISDPRLDLRHADLHQMTGSFDLVVCMNVLEHIEDDRAALRQLWRLVGPGGTLFLLVPAHQSLFTSFDAESGHFRRYNKRAMRGLMRDVAAARADIRSFYFNSIGALGYWVVYKVRGKPPRASAGSEIGWFDRAVVPWLRRLEPRATPLGISLVAIATRSAE
jgi:SAM-dependent methyltransferase